MPPIQSQAHSAVHHLGGIPHSEISTNSPRQSDDMRRPLAAAAAASGSNSSCIISEDGTSAPPKKRRRDGLGPVSHSKSSPQRARQQDPATTMPTQTRTEKSCAECRRLKLRCSRTWPCTSCIKRHCAALCPDGVMKKDPIDHASLLHHTDLLFKYVASLEGVIQKAGFTLPTHDEATPVSIVDFLEKCTGETTSDKDLQSLTLPLKQASSHSRHSSSSSSCSGETAAGEAKPNAVLSQANSARLSLSHYSQSLSATAQQEDSHGENAGSSDPGLPDAYAIPHPPSRNDNPCTEGNAQEKPKRRQGFGTLAISESGSSKYIGPSAGSEWLNSLEAEGWSSHLSSKEPKRHEGTSNARLHRRPSGLSPSSTHSDRSERSWEHQGQSAILPLLLGSQLSPLSTGQKTRALASLAHELPEKKEAVKLARWYFRHSSWQYLLIRESKLMSILDSVYRGLSRPEDSTPTAELASLYGGAATAAVQSRSYAHTRNIKADELSLVFTVLALGAWFDLTKSLDEAAQSSREWFDAGQATFATTGFLSSNSVTSVQILHLTALYVLEAHHTKGGDIAWPLLGLASRMTHTMGMHIDGEAWNLDPEHLNERRRQFWEIYTHDTFQAICFGRPATLHAHEYNCKLPLEEEAQSPGFSDDEASPDAGDLFNQGVPRNVGFHTLRFRLSRIVRRMISEAFSIKAPKYRDILAFDTELRAFEDQIPFFMRCRASCSVPVMVYPAGVVSDQKPASSPSFGGHRFNKFPANKSMPSYGSPGEERRPSPDRYPNRVRLTLQQHDLASSIVQFQLFLHRKPFAEAILLDPKSPSKTPYGYSFLTALDAARQMIVITESLYTTYPNLIIRIWTFWYNSFSAAVLCAFCCLHAPSSDQARFAYEQVTKTCGLLEDAKASPRNEQALKTLLRLQERAQEAMSQARRAQSGPRRGVSVASGLAHAVDKSRSSSQSLHNASNNDAQAKDSRRRSGKQEEETYTSEDHEAAQAMMGISTRLLRCSEGPFTRDNSPEPSGDIERPDYMEHSYAAPALTQQDLDSLLPSDHQTVQALTNLQPLAHSNGDSLQRGQSSQAAWPTYALDGLTQSTLPGHDSSRPQEGFDFASQNSTSSRWAPVGGSAATPQLRQELQTDLERLLSMDDIWCSFPPSSDANENGGGASGNEVNHDISGYLASLENGANGISPVSAAPSAAEASSEWQNCKPQERDDISTNNQYAHVGSRAAFDINTMKHVAESATWRGPDNDPTAGPISCSDHRTTASQEVPGAANGRLSGQKAAMQQKQKHSGADTGLETPSNGLEIQGFNSPGSGVLF
ncbi:unnamed protein product [Sympodiomycopsis kandeliae]